VGRLYGGHLFQRHTRYQPRRTAGQPPPQPEPAGVSPAAPAPGLGPARRGPVQGAALDSALG